MLVLVQKIGWGEHISLMLGFQRFGIKHACLSSIFQDSSEDPLILTGNTSLEYYLYLTLNLGMSKATKSRLKVLAVQEGKHMGQQIIMVHVV